MDLVVRTPHGHAELAIVNHAPECTVGDLIVAVSGQAAPRLARIDDRTVDSSTRLDDAGLLVGSTVSTEPDLQETGRLDGVGLLQITGAGAGRSRRLSVGTHRLGPGRRMAVDELSDGAVDVAMLDVTVSPDGSVTVDPPPSDGSRPGVSIGGVLVRSSTVWNDALLSVAGRTFTIDRQSPPSRRRPQSEPSGTVAFARPPRRPEESPRLPAINAVRDATFARPSLWQRRLNQPDALRIPIGIRAGSDEIVALDLLSARCVAVVGGEIGRTAVGRSMLIEAATLHGPADVDVVVMAASDRLGEWDWAKWLPHIRIDGRTMIVDDVDELAEFFEQRTAWPAGHVTLLIVDDQSLWLGHGSRSLLSILAPDALVIALCDDLDHAPAISSVAITESSDQMWQLLDLNSRGGPDVIAVAMTETAVACETARALAPLVDTEIPDRTSRPTEPRRGLLDHVGQPGAPELRQRWTDLQTDLTTVPITDDLAIDLASQHLFVTAGDAELAAQVVTTLVVTACLRLDPSALLVLDMMPTRALDGFPQVERAIADDVDPDRLIARLRHVLDDDTGDGAPQFVVVALEATNPLRTALLAADLPHLRLVIAAVDELDIAGSATIDVDATMDRSRATIRFADAFVDVDLDGDIDDETGLQLRPIAVGRALSALEQRLTRHRGGMPSEFIARCNELARTATEAAGAVAPTRLVPPHLPTSIDSELFVLSWPGDAVPIGLIDVASTGAQPLWWQPHDGALLAFGSLRSGVDDVVATVLLGMIDRVSPDDARLVVIERSAARRTMIQAVDRRHVVVDSEQPHDVLALLGVLDEERGDSTLVVVVDDLGLLRSRARALDVLERLDRGLATADSVVAVVRVADDAGPLLHSPGRRLIGMLADHDEQRHFGVEPDGTRGRCVIRETGEIVQLAALARPLVDAIADRLRDGAT